MRYTYLVILTLLCTVMACKEPQARKPISVKSGISLKASAERTKKRLAAENEAIQHYIKNDSTQQYFNSNHGFWYTYLKKETLDSITPKYGNKVQFTYSIQNLKNDTIYNRSEIGTKTHYIRQENIMEGLRQGLMLMKSNEEIKFIFPSQIAYGYKGDLNKIAPNTPIICNIVLHNIETKTENK